MPTNSNVVVANIIVGPGHLYIAKSADITTDVFEEDSAGNATHHVGATTDGVEIAFEPEFGEVEVDQLKDAALIFNSGAQCTVSTNLAEATLENLAIAWGYDPDAAVSAGTFSFGIPADRPEEFELGVEGPAPNGQTRKFSATRAISVAGSTFGLRKSEQTQFSVEFRILADPLNSDLYGTIVDA